MEFVSYQDFSKLDLRVAQILSAKKVERADKLLVLEIDLGGEKRQIVAGIAEYYSPEELVGTQIVVVANLQPRKIRGLWSQGMLLAADVDGRPVLLRPDKPVPPGSKVL